LEKSEAAELVALVGEMMTGEVIENSITTQASAFFFVCFLVLAHSLEQAG
jgi:hypothetical protein